ncbi:MAG: right-handed parallel beta-helix repeat-containing protein [Pseudomonadota bacterium]
MMRIVLIYILTLISVPLCTSATSAHEHGDDTRAALERVLSGPLAGESEAVKNGLRLKYRVMHARPGDIITLDPGVYTLKVPSTYNVDRFFHYEGDVIDLKVNQDLTLRGGDPDPSKTIIDWAGSPYAEKLAKGLIVSREAKHQKSFPANITLAVENLTFRNAVGYSNNGAALRPQGTKLLVRNCRFINNQNGILYTSVVEQVPLSPHYHAGELIVENSVFDRNGESIGELAHAIYFSRGDRLSVRNSRFVNTKNNGHHIKSLARETLVTGSFFSNVDEEITYIIDTPNGGDVTVQDNIIEYYPATDGADNRNMFTYASMQTQNNKTPGPLGAFHFRENTVTIYHPRASSIVTDDQSQKAITACGNELRAGDGVKISRLLRQFAQGQACRDAALSEQQTY